MFKKMMAAALLSTTMLVGTTAASGNVGLLLYKDADYKTWLGTRTSAGWWNMSGNANDELTSFINDTKMGVAFWHDANKSGKCLDYGPGAMDPQFSWNDNDRMSSYALGRGC